MADERKKKLFAAGMLMIAGSSRSTLLQSLSEQGVRNGEALMWHQGTSGKGGKVPRVEGYIERVVTMYNDCTFRQHFRLHRATLEYVISQIAQTVPERIHSVETKVLHFLWLLGNMETFRSVADRFGVSKSTLHRNVRQIATSLLSLRSKEIKFPSSEADMRKASKQFKIPGTLGCIDGTYIPMTGKSGERRDAYICRKGFPAMHAQVVCDAKLIILDFLTGYPGSVHDARVYRNSPLHRMIKNLPTQYHLLGDSAYPLDNFLITKFKDNGFLTPEQKKFNSLHGAERSCIERCIGLLKGKFRRLKNFDARDDELLCNSAMACAVLHNIILVQEGIFEDDITMEDVSHPNDNVSDEGLHEQAAAEKRNNLCFCI